MFDFDCLNVSWRERCLVFWNENITFQQLCGVTSARERYTHDRCSCFIKSHPNILISFEKNNLPCFLVYYLISTLTTGCLHPLRYFLLFFLLLHTPINFNWKFASIYHIRGKSLVFFFAAAINYQLIDHIVIVIECQWNFEISLIYLPTIQCPK